MSLQAWIYVPQRLYWEGSDAIIRKAARRRDTGGGSSRTERDISFSAKNLVEGKRLVFRVATALRKLGWPMRAEIFDGEHRRLFRIRVKKPTKRSSKRRTSRRR